MKKKPEEGKGSQAGKKPEGVRPEGEAKYAEEECAVCGGNECEKKWLGQFFHKKCLRKMKKTARGMI